MRNEMRPTIRMLMLLSTSSLGSAAWGQSDESALASELQAMRAKIESLEAKVKELEGAKKAELPSWKGAPQFESKDAGFSFKPKGFAQFDAGYVGTPGPERAGTVGGLNYNNLGWNMRARRLVFG